MAAKDSLRILKIEACPTLSHNATINYHIGYSSAGSEVFFRIYASTGGGLPYNLTQE